jgi:hypothetical protein
MDCKIITIEVEEKVFLVGCPDTYECFEIQYKLGGHAYNLPKYMNRKMT